MFVSCKFALSKFRAWVECIYYMFLWMWERRLLWMINSIGICEIRILVFLVAKTSLFAEGRGIALSASIINICLCTSFKVWISFVNFSINKFLFWQVNGWITQLDWLLLRILLPLELERYAMYSYGETTEIWCTNIMQSPTHQWWYDILG